ncbi:PRP38 pre-mRNA processing factor 38 domain-containing protein B [Phlyctochytrium planicorne]|nr:PRP38 pre-mRNA processing factor 38 domain-containing protein B [Phlyctochytrium planicorne]
MGYSKDGKLQTVGNETTMNLNQLVYQNIISSPYFKSLYEKKSFDEVVDEIYYKVKSLEPFLKGTTVSTAFCLLYKLWTMRLTENQVFVLVNHSDSPHIRGLGFLYLRYVCEPSQLWEWFAEYVDDGEPIQIEGGPKPRSSTIGQVCRDLLSENKWLGTMLPRIPVPIARDINKRLQESSQKPAYKEPSQKGKNRHDDDDEYYKDPRNNRRRDRGSYLDYDDPRDRERRDRYDEGHLKEFQDQGQDLPGEMVRDEGLIHPDAHLHLGVTVY